LDLNRPREAVQLLDQVQHEVFSHETAASRTMLKVSIQLWVTLLESGTNVKR
jgi:hypothetical protein